MISEALISVSKVDDTALGEAVLLDVVLHDTVVLMGIDSDVYIMRETEVHDIAKDAVNIWITGYTMNDMVGQGVVCPLTIIYLRVGRLRRVQKGEIADDATSVLNDKATMLLHIADDDSLRRVAVSPLVHVTRLPHDLLCGLYHLHNLRYVCWLCFPDNPIHIYLPNEGTKYTGFSS